MPESQVILQQIEGFSGLNHPSRAFPSQTIIQSFPVIMASVAELKAMDPIATRERASFVKCKRDIPE
jgi:hypothetical protein